VRDAERTRARLGLALLAGVFLTGLSGLLLLPWLGYPVGFVAAAAAGALPTFALLGERIGRARAALLAALVAVALCVVAIALALVAYIAGGVS
jgi:hypothetical protein